ncbi:MAG: response regulator [Sulfurospirillaceae bacterium]|jgi:DNA-binding response OmpR family regulator|nr:response regulator [Sulfurospirillaceae bacterium]MDD2826284.1 response regulator [Sulfurospirillaceae bacterium]
MEMAKLALLKHLSILYVEDDEGIRSRISKSLSYYFKEVYEANNGEEGFTMYESISPDIVLSDIQMAHGTGIDLAKKIRLHDKHTPIVMFSAFGKEEYLLELINIHINYFVLKPANAERLLEGLLEALDITEGESIVLSKELLFAPFERKLYYKGEAIALNKREKEFLMLLSKQKKQITPYALIEDIVWDGKMMSMEALKTFIKELRKKVPIGFLENIPQEGYRLIF